MQTLRRSGFYAWLTLVVATTRWLPLPLAPALVLTVAGIEEYLQRLSPRSDSSFGDFAADVAGVVALTCASRWIGRRLDERFATLAG